MLKISVTIPDPRITPSSVFHSELLSLGANTIQIGAMFGIKEVGAAAARRKLERRILTDSAATRRALAMELVLLKLNKIDTNPPKPTSHISTHFERRDSWHWANRSQPEIMRYLIAKAMKGRTAQYGVMHDQLAAMGLITHAGPDTQLGAPLGLIGWSLCNKVLIKKFSGRRPGLLSVLCCRQPGSGSAVVPGRGFDQVAVDYCQAWLKDKTINTSEQHRLREWMQVFKDTDYDDPQDLYRAERVAAVRSMQNDCFEFDGWNDILGHFELGQLDID